ncbi:MAG: T9SS type A sorting domain-containing protein [Candidatus Latescibacteria bacterium]|nr:T9SS type A sorting domain-containing protein [Candidatus Latescibacterota bacterium]
MRYLQNILFPLMAIISVSQADADGVWKSYTNTNYIYNIAVSGDNIWCGTSGGVVHWNMSDEIYECFTVDDGLPSDFINRIGIDAKGEIWAHCDVFGIWIFDGLSWQKRFNDITSFKSMAIDRDGITWIANRFYGVYSYDGITVAHYTTEDGLIDKAVISLIVDSNNVKWFGTKKGVSRLDGQIWTSFTSENGLAGDTVYSIAEDMNGVIWFATNQGVSIYNGNDWKTYTTEDGFPPGASITYIVVDNDNIKWFGTSYTGLLRYDDTSFTTYSMENSDIPDNEILDLSVDRNGVLWLSLEQEFYRSGHGLTGFDGTLWKNYRTDGPVHNIARGVTVDQNNVKWFLTNGGISGFDGTSWTQYTDEDYLSVWLNEVDVVTDRDNVRWSGSNNGVRSFDGTTLILYTTDNGLVSNRVFDVAVDYNNVKWFCTDHGISSFDGKKWITYDESNGFVDENIISVTVDTYNMKWFATHIGLWRYNDNEWTLFTSENSGLRFNQISNIVADMNNHIWIALYIGYGLQSFDGSVWKTYTEKDGYLGWQILSMAVDHNNVKWFGTYNGGVISYDDGIKTFLEISNEEPENVKLLNSYPNPFNSSTTIEFVLPHESIVNLAVYDILGQKVRDLIRQPMQTGFHSVLWDGKNKNGNDVSTGVYFYVLQTDNTSIQSKGLYVK